ncbi:diguanylate cyclase domain-containing protein, partial [Shigella flexneri]
GKNIIRWLLKKRTNGSVRYCQYTSFIIIVKAANDEEACRAGVRICQLVDNHAITHSEGHINITVTAGVSRAFPEEPLDVVIGRADRAMYEGKQTGRNRCMFIDEQNVINRV